MRAELRDDLAPVHAGQQAALRLRIGITHLDAHQEAVELRFRQRKGADLVCGVLRGDDEERHGQRARRAFYGHLLFLHRLEQRALRLGRGAIDLVRQDHLRKDRAGMEFEFAGFCFNTWALIHRHAEDIGGQQVAGELDALELQAQRARQHVRQRGLADTRQILDQQVAARQQARKRETDLFRLAEDDLLGLLDDVVQVLAHVCFIKSGKSNCPRKARKIRKNSRDFLLRIDNK